MVVLPQDRSLRLILHPLVALPVAGLLLGAVVGEVALSLARQPVQGGLWGVVTWVVTVAMLLASLVVAAWLMINSAATRGSVKAGIFTALASITIVTLVARHYGPAIGAALGPDTAGWVLWVASNAAALTLITLLVGTFALVHLHGYLREKAERQYDLARTGPVRAETFGQSHHDQPLREPKPSYHQSRQRRGRRTRRHSESPAQDQLPVESLPPPIPSPPPTAESQSSARWTPRSAVVRRGPSWDEVILPEATKYALLTAQRILHDPDSFRRQFHAEPPRGIILYGPPGTGKTLIARTLATSAGYTFITASPAEMNQMYMGASEKVIAELYERARQSAPCVVFLDEVDAIAAPRSAGADPGGAGRAQNSLLNQLLQELDGFHQSPEMVFTIAATNRLDNLDPAFKSRFASQIEIGLPDDAARLALFKLYTEGYRDRLIYPLGRLVIRSKGMGGRDITNICRQAALYTFGTKRLLVGYFAYAYAFEQLGRPLASAVIQKSVAETWAKEQLGEAELLTRAKAHFGTVLTEQFKAEGKTLEAKVKSVADRLSEGQVGALLLVAGLQTLESPTAFIEDCRELEEELYLALNEPSEKN